nr:hypothetical protein [Tanacetum cinerariifolium]
MDILSVQVALDHSRSHVHQQTSPSIPTGINEFPLPEQLPTAYEDKFPLLIQSDATAERIALVLKTEMDQQNPTLAKIPILDTGKFEQWQFRIQQYLQHEHYALWEVIEFRDSYEAPDDIVATGSATEGTGKKKGRTVALTTEDM